MVELSIYILSVGLKQKQNNLKNGEVSQLTAHMRAHDDGNQFSHSSLSALRYARYKEDQVDGFHAAKYEEGEVSIQR